MDKKEQEQKVRPFYKRPKNAKLVFDGEIFQVYQWKQKLYDGSYTIFEQVAHKYDSVTIIPVLKNKKILLTKQQQPTTKTFISLPGGRIDKGEKPKQAGLRELREETGFSSDDMHLFRVVQSPLLIDWNLYHYIAFDCEKVDEQHLDPGEKITTFEVEIDEFFDMILKNKLREKLLSFYITRLIVLGYKKNLIDFFNGEKDALLNIQDL